MEHIFDMIKMDSSNSRIKVSITESTMMQILHTAMDKAYRKVKSKNGVLERLNEISRFYELAVIQLEGCLKFVQEERDHDFVLESSQELLLEDLTEIRDRLQGRLKEVELAISDKDKELVERLGNELKLKKALEINEKELDSLHADLKLEQRKSEGIGELFLSRQASSDSGDKEGEFCELKNSVDQQVWNIQQHLEPNYKLRDEKRSKEIDNKKIEQMGSDIGVLKETLDLAFCKMRNAIFLSELGPIEHQWMWNIERGIAAIVVKGSLKDFREIFEEEVKRIEMQVSVGFRKRLSDLIREMTNLNHELELVSNREEVQVKSLKPKGLLKAKGRCLSESESFGYSSNTMKQLCNEDSEEDSSNYVAKMIKNHESIIRKKSEELNLLTRELLPEKADPPLRRERDCVNPKRRIQKVIWSLESLINLKPGIGNTIGDIRPHSEVDKGKSGIDSMEEVWAKVNKTSVSQARNEEPCSEMRMLKQEMEDVESMEEVWAKVNKISVQSREEKYGSNKFFESAAMSIMDDVCNVFLACMIKELELKIYAFSIESLIREDVFQFVIVEAVKEAYIVEEAVDKVCISIHESVLDPMQELSQTLKSLECESCTRLGRHMLRLDEMKLQLDLVSKLTASIIQNESLYRKAFVRRCENLEMAETEVDLLGDQVDILQGLLKKIYVTLRRHSPVLRQYFEHDDLQEANHGKTIGYFTNFVRRVLHVKPPLVIHGDEKDGRVVELTAKNFSSFISKKKFVMLNFYMPLDQELEKAAYILKWTKDRDQELEAAANILKAEVAFAKVDASMETELAEKYFRPGFPALILFAGTNHMFSRYERTRYSFCWILLAKY
ncbi:hypothetical protein PTKIN_Ptkin16aG0117200 [Pterospermum kingtungense]